MKQACPDCHGVLRSHPAHMERTLTIHQQSCPARGVPRNTKKEKENAEEPG